eukprot:SM000183S04012  [mRNA]  locus=s183:215183:218386:- [translate_table: standard]
MREDPSDPFFKTTWTEYGTPGTSPRNLKWPFTSVSVYPPLTALASTGTPASGEPDRDVTFPSALQQQKKGCRITYMRGCTKGACIYTQETHMTMDMPQSPYLEEGSEMHRSGEEVEDCELAAFARHRVLPEAPGSGQGQEDGGERLLRGRPSDHVHYDLGQLFGLEGVTSQVLQEVASSYRGPAKKRPSGPLNKRKGRGTGRQQLFRTEILQALLCWSRYVLSGKRNVLVRDAAIMVRPDDHIQTMVSPKCILVHSIRVGSIRPAPKPCPISQVNI